MSERDSRRETSATGEPGTVAVTVADGFAPPPTYKPDFKGTAPKLRVQNLHVTYRNHEGVSIEAVKRQRLKLGRPPCGLVRHAHVDVSKQKL